jgi:hypothetical protein
MDGASAWAGVLLLGAALAVGAALLASRNRLQRSAQRVEECAANLRAVLAAGGTDAGSARRAYNAVVRAHNSACGAWPAAWVARAAGIRRASYLPGDETWWYWLRRGGLPQGPEPRERLLAMRLDGRLGDDVVVALAGTDRWQPIDVLADRRRPQP